jgi:hypothetical protein
MLRLLITPDPAKVTSADLSAVSADSAGDMLRDGEFQETLMKGSTHAYICTYVCTFMNIHT